MNKLQEIIHKHLGAGGRMISFSKSRYREQYPNNKVYFNAQIHDENRTFLWVGDLDITKDLNILKTIEKESGEFFYLTPELWRDMTVSDIDHPSTLKFGENTMINIAKERFISAIDKEYTQMMKVSHSAEDIRLIHDLNRKIKDLITSL